mmetsp:Transcript_97014/g.313269  ORF Transcript_97014/g.313269 Transcript_97014/m.313269 type:complete len:233 (-) Transcript_97014:95-793(-)
MAEGTSGGEEQAADAGEAAGLVPATWPRVEEGSFPDGEHPLETAWTLWVDKKSSDRKEQSAYIEGLKQLGTFRTIEEFLRLYAFVKKPSSFPRDYNLFCFRSGCQPMWEEFPDGGCWNYRMRRGGGAEDPVDRAWESLLIACLGEAFETPDVVGCVMGSRVKEIAISVWNASNTKDPQVRFKIGERMREVLCLNTNALLEYKNHQSSMQDFSTYRNAQVYIMRTPGAMGTSE